MSTCLASGVIRLVLAASNRQQSFRMSSARIPQVDYPPYGLQENIKKLEEWIQVRGTISGRY